jgi:hypothetical protein
MEQKDEMKVLLQLLVERKLGNGQGYLCEAHPKEKYLP